MSEESFGGEVETINEFEFIFKGIDKLGKRTFNERDVNDFVKSFLKDVYESEFGKTISWS